ncbi:capsule biosynthesis GfcC family protein, partial [Gammaproteobacteria bacterium]|nr:capsule biosynthesis GfcC family protein [Gammaproteobacteria bacterium]
TELYSYIKVKNNYTNKGIDTITLIGQFNNPGVYKIESKETISQLVKRAGGFRDDAYPIAGIYTRESIKIIEEQALEKSSKELADLLSTAITSGYLKQDSADLMNLMSIMNQANTIEASGRLITNLDADSIQGTKNDFFVMPGDVFYLPKRPHSVTVSGNVLNPLTVSYDPGLSYRDYISLAGGFKDNGSKKNTFIILPNGKTFQPTSRIFSNNKSFILPGSTIIVPREARPLSGLSLVEVLSPTLANLSVTAASIAAITKN